MSFNEYYSKVENAKNQQQDWAETMSTMQSIFSTNQTFLQSIYKETLPLEDKSFFIEAANSVNEGLWKKSKIQFNTYSTHVGYYYEGSNINNHIAGATVKAYIADAVCQIHWPDGTIHIFDKEIHAETVLPKKHEGFFISLIDEQKRFPKLRKELGQECLKKANSLVKMHAGSQEYVKISFWRGGDQYAVTLFKDGNAYGYIRKVDGYFKQGFAEEIYRMNKEIQ